MAVPDFGSDTRPGPAWLFSLLSSCDDLGQYNPSNFDLDSPKSGSLLFPSNSLKAVADVGRARISVACGRCRFFLQCPGFRGSWVPGIASELLRVSIADPTSEDDFVISKISRVENISVMQRHLNLNDGQISQYDGGSRSSRKRDAGRRAGTIRVSVSRLSLLHCDWADLREGENGRGGHDEWCNVSKSFENSGGYDGFWDLLRLLDVATKESVASKNKALKNMGDQGAAQTLIRNEGSV
ncbi:hypothetical protein B0H11DRAFT_1940601 [Mycena galericulata]|nr:hypothetical protein B0H11DRAFT_1940601 [Mycena galericulata]